MFSVSAEIFDILSLAMRYVFAVMGLLIVLRAYRWLLADKRERKARLRHLPDAGMIGEFVVLSGSGNLNEGLSLPVPREGVLGALRSCDLVVPCRGVHHHHLDFVWQEGLGLLIHPRSGCCATVNQIPMTTRSDPASAPLRHGSFLQVGDALLRLRVFAGLDSNAGFDEPAPVHTEQLPDPPSVQTSVSQEMIWQSPDGEIPPAVPPVSIPSSDTPAEDVQAVSAPVRRRRSDRWKEDWSE